ncbi:MAG: BCCT family transporter [Eubacterium sp.]|nr:BCCT family transporter [Eubacterium sp.]
MTKKYDVVTIVVSLGLMAALVIGTIFAGDSVISGLGNAKNFVIYKFGWLFIILVAAILFYVLWLAFSKYGSIRMGREKPKFGWFGYASMIFCAAMGSSMIFWPSVEYAEYICWTDVWPFGWGVEEMAENSLSYSFFHWGIPAWAIYAAGIVPIGYRYYVMKKPGLTIQGGCEGVFGEKAVKGPLGTVINIIFILGILGGLTITYGTGIPMLANFLHNVFGTPENYAIDVILILALTALFTWSALSGIEKGILYLSKLCIILCGVMLGLILILGNTGYIINSTTQSIGSQFQNFFSMLFNVGPGLTEPGTNFAMEWTVFYWAWWIGLAPVMWIFIAKCSRGRTIRSIILTVIGAGVAADVLFFGVISGNGLSLYKDFDWSTLGQGSTPLDAFYNTWDEFALISDTLAATVDVPKLVIGVWLVGTFILLVTTMDSSAYTMAAATQKGLGVNDDPKKRLRLFWALMLSVSPLCILGAGAGTSSCTAVVILTAVPVVFLVVIAIIGSTKWILRDFGGMTREQITAYFETDEEKEERSKAIERMNAML